VKVRLVHTVTQQHGTKLYAINTKLLAQLYTSATAAVTRTAVSIATDCTRSSAGTASSTTSEVSGASMLAVQQSVQMKTIVIPEGWQFTMENVIKLIAYDL
jgi:hypothetical protein